MPICCPVCKADNASGPSCRRCKADLSLLLAVERQRRVKLHEALMAIAAGNFEQARKSALSADRLRMGIEAKRMLAVAELMLGNFSAAWHLCRAATEDGSAS